METPFYCIVIFSINNFLCANKANSTEKRNKKSSLYGLRRIIKQGDIMRYKA